MTDQDSVKRINGFGDTANVDVVEKYKDLGEGHHARVVATSPITQIQEDAGGRLRVSQITTLGDYKNVWYDHLLLWENAGNGSGVFSNSIYAMSVEANEWLVKSTRRFHHYFSGKSQGVELTFDNFHPETDVAKRCGYFSSSIVSPYSESLDGFWLESDGETIRIIVSNAGVETLNIALEDWDRYDLLAEYKNPDNWQNFTVILFDFLWLGGAVIRLWVQTSGGFVLAHSFIYAGTVQGTFIESPNQPVRYEIRSSGGSGTFRYVCCQVSTEGSIVESGLTFGADSGVTAINGAVIGTKYPLKAVRRNSAYRGAVIRIEDITIMVASANDRVLWSLEINPTLSGPLSYVNLPNSAIQHANGNGTITVTSPGTIIASGYLLQGTTLPSNFLKKNYLDYFGHTLAGVEDQYVLCITPITANVDSHASIILKEY